MPTTSPPHADSPKSRARLAARPLRWLVALSLILPAFVLGAGAWTSYQQHYLDARDRLERDLSRIYEHALKVFETFDLSSRYLDEVLADVTDEQVRAQENLYNARLKVLTDSLPQLRDIWVIDASGFPVVSGTVFPMPKIDLSDRVYFSVHKDHKILGPYVSDVIAARAADLNFFAISRPRPGSNGAFGGVTVISIKPEYFVSYYAGLPTPVSASLLKSDGAVLARYPDPAPGPAHLSRGPGKDQLSELIRIPPR